MIKKKKSLRVGILTKKYTSKEILPAFLNVNDMKIPPETEVKLLGMTIDNKLKFG